MNDAETKDRRGQTNTSPLRHCWMSIRSVIEEDLLGISGFRFFPSSWQYVASRSVLYIELGVACKAVFTMPLIIIASRFGGRWVGRFAIHALCSPRPRGLGKLSESFFPLLRWISTLLTTTRHIR